MHPNAIFILSICGGMMLLVAGLATIGLYLILRKRS